MPRMRRVAILIETSRGYGRGLLRGVARFHAERGHWSTYFQPRGLGDPPPRWLKDWQGDGILARIENQRMADAVIEAGVPAVNLRGTIAELPFPFIGAGNRAVARLAAEHLLGRGFKHFGFCGLPRGSHPGMDDRTGHFRELIRKAGYQCHMFGLRRRRAESDTWEQEQTRLAEWIAGLPKPIGVMARNDDLGLQVLDACRRIDTMVPDEVAVLGVDNDEHLCGLSIPPLSSIDLNCERIGHEAAALLDRMMSGKAPPHRKREISPVGVVTRQSTDVLATDDGDVVRAVRYIRRHACDSIKVGDVLSKVSISRASLEPRLKAILGRTIHQEIQRVRIDKIKVLLATTDLPIKQITQIAGFNYLQYMTRLFHKVTGKTPAQFRRETRR